MKRRSAEDKALAYALGMAKLAAIKAVKEQIQAQHGRQGLRTVTLATLHQMANALLRAQAKPKA